MRAAKENRTVPDRRRVPTTLLSTLRFSRRRRFRRAGEQRDQYVDHLPPCLTTLIVSIFVMSATDAICTLVHIARGGAEANPAMNWLLAHGIIAFLVGKALLTIVGVTFLAVHHNFRGTVPTLYSVMCGYVALMGFHVFVSQQ